MSIRNITASEISEAVEKLVIEANYCLPQDVKNALERARDRELSPLCREVLGDILKNAEIAAVREMPICQDTGLAVFFVEIGQDVHIEGDFQSAMDEGVSRGYKNGYLRKSTQDNALSERVNRGDNTPAICHIELCSGDKIKITFCPKGGGSENMSAVGMLMPSQGREGVKKFIVDTLRKAGSNPCPPVIVGVGVGGTMEKAAILAKKALCREVGALSEDADTAAFEKDVLEEINALGIGAQGFGGTQTALAVHVLTHPVHLASLPVAVNIQCHAARHKTVVI